ncbi:SagB family peptide dehydrogenase [Microbacterium rhizomatis]|uniref:SagB/ThcOx family dehydrogenase n=1 Tax=Microbacterium rhizomatis TaxID=1631477 RepID=A0A5J5J1S1_9MICO|nr:SagB family peptide dehydrogenase [Microbacterium rhizomatis]KAA9108435.1 SagB/ThcOx family dehydrogenase [Microbacterium rhizomatis]
MSGGMLVALRDRTAVDLGASPPVLERAGIRLPMPALAAPEAGPLARVLAAPTDAVTLSELAAEGGPVALARWMTWSRRAMRFGLLAYRLVDEHGELIAEFVPTAAGAPDLADPAPLPSASLLLLSRFALLHRGDGALTLESPQGTLRAELSGVAAAVVAAFMVPRTGAAASIPGMNADTAETLVAALYAGGLLVTVDDDGRAAEDDDPVLSQWELPDLLLHARSRYAVADRPRGGTFRFVGIRPAPAALAFDFGVPAIPLPRPDLDLLAREDPPFAAVMEARASRRSLGPIDAARLGEFLYRSVRVRRAFDAGDDPRDYPMTVRPHPAGGGMHELTTYLVIGECADIERGFYRYDPVGHGLDPVAPWGPRVHTLLGDAGKATGSDIVPPLAVILAADFRRLSWKYEGIAYPTILKNVGVVYATMQLVATAMGLGSCPLGGGDSELFALAAGTRAIEHTSVGEFLLGA